MFFCRRKFFACAALAPRSENFLKKVFRDLSKTFSLLAGLLALHPLKDFLKKVSFAGLLALHPANIFAPPKILDKKAAQELRPCVSHIRTLSL